MPSYLIGIDGSSFIVLTTYRQSFRKIAAVWNISHKFVPIMNIALTMNTENLLNKQKIEPNRIDSHTVRLAKLNIRIVYKHK